MKLILQKLLEFIHRNGGAHKQKYWCCSDKHYCLKCKYASDICMYGEDENDLHDKTPCAQAWVNTYFK